MAKVFRFHSGDNTLEDWQATQVYGKTEIEGIADPTGATSKRQITSIPSPFARIDLVQTAFLYLSQKEHPLDGETMYHKIVSDALDLGEILFNIDLLDKISILPWDKDKHINALINSPNEKHKLFGETLKLYLDQDAQAYNFDKLKNIYLVEHDHQIIGGTSPATLFFTSANEIKNVNISFGDDLVFDPHYQALYRRDPEYQKYLHHLMKAYPELSRKMKYVQEYLNRNLKMLEVPATALLFSEINKLKAETFNRIYDTLNTGKAGEDIEILGFALRKRHKATASNIARESDFVIKSEKYINADKPLVLQNNLNKALKYTTDNWNKNVSVPYAESEETLAKRKLPGQIVQYPYLTVSDFLEPYLIRTIYTTNKEYFDGNLQIESGDPGKGYLLPLKPLFFEFFNSEELVRKKMHDGKPMIEMVQRVMSSVTVTLRIPIKKENEYVTFERVYYPPASENDMVQPNVEQNKGAITEGFFNVVLFPFFKHPEGINPDYRAVVIDRDTDGYRQKNHYELGFYVNADKNKLTANRRERSNKNVGDTVSSAFYLVKNNFDYIQIQNGTANAMLVPLFPPSKMGSTSYSFAIDFGTTNTHIEWKKDDSKTTYPFEITKNDLQYSSLIDPELGYLLIPELQNWVDHELFPQTISKNDPYHFPHRTILSFAKTLKYTWPPHVTYSLSDFNIPFIYERQPLHKNTGIRSNLKWSDESGNQVLVRRFFENLVFLIRNKILLNGGDISKATIISFFPSSMDEGRRKAFNDILTKPGEGVIWEYFPDTLKYTSISESLAPYYYAANTQAISSSDRPVATIDVGGGTTDIMVFHKEQPSFLTSFRFAAHSVFGDGFNGSSKVNGFVQKYFMGLDGQGGYKAMAEGVFPLPMLFSEMEDHSSVDIISFLFSLADNHALKVQQKKMSLFDDLSNDKDLKTILVVFTGSILYHMARCMHCRKLPPPKTIILSGNGSKIFSIVEGSTGFDGMEIFAKAIFQKIYQDNSVSFEIKFMQDDQPKQITCKGGLFFKSDDLYDAFNKGRSEQIRNLGRVMDALKYTHFGGTSIPYNQGKNEKQSETKSDSLLSSGLMESSAISSELLETPTYREVEENPDYKKAVLIEVNNCLTHLFEIMEDPKLRVASLFRINESALDRIQSKLKEALIEDMNLGISSKLKELQGKITKELDETLFFYAFTGAINKTAFAIVKGLA